MPELYDRAAALAGRVHRRRAERRVYPPRKADWSTGAYVRAYFSLNTRQPGFGDKGSGVYAYAPGEHADLYETLSWQPQAPVIDDGVEELDTSSPTL
ncbi:MAG TPA: hypothetical protein DEP24_07760 [Mycobacterium sp.]|nr:hypothetical protein [Mycobacterium sp.]